MLSAYPKRLLWFPVILLAMLAVSACQTTPKSTGGYSKFGKVVSSESLLNTNLKDAGAIFVGVSGNDTFKHKLWLNGTPLAHQGFGVIFLPVLPGEYDFSYNSDGSVQSLKVPVTVGKTSFVTSRSIFAFGTYRLSSETEFKKSWWAENSVRQILTDQPAYGYLPAAKKALVDTCLTNKKSEDCKRALDEVPNVILSSSDILDRMEATLKPQQPVIAETEPASALPIAVSKAPAPARKPKIVNLPPEIERDRLMVQIADLFKANNAVDALPLFERLNALPVPIDPVSDFYWAQSLLANGDRVGASAKLTRFIGTIDAQSPFYAPALRLMTRIEG